MNNYILEMIYGLVDAPPVVIYNLIRLSESLHESIAGEQSWQHNGTNWDSFAAGPDGEENGHIINAFQTGHTFLQTVSVEPGATYNFSFWAKRGTLTEAKWSIWSPQYGEIIAPASYYSLINSSTWTRVSVTATMPAGVTTANFYPLRDAGVTGNIYLTMVQVSKGASLLDYQQTN